MLDTTEVGEMHIRLPADGCGLVHEVHATQFVAIYKDALGMVRVDMLNVDDDLVRLLDKDVVMSSYVPIEP